MIEALFVVTFTALVMSIICLIFGRESKRPRSYIPPSDAFGPADWNYEPDRPIGNPGGAG